MTTPKPKPMLPLSLESNASDTTLSCDCSQLVRFDRQQSGMSWIGSSFLPTVRLFWFYTGYSKRIVASSSSAAGEDLYTFGALDATGISPVKVGFVWRHLKQFRATSGPCASDEWKRRAWEVPGKFENRSALRDRLAQLLRNGSRTVRQAARTESRNFATSTLRRLLSPDSICAAESTCVEADPVSPAPRCTSVMFAETC